MAQEYVREVPKASDISTMTNLSEEEIRQEIARRIQEVARPRKIILFGSRARGEGKADSDCDLLIVKDEIKSRQDESHQIRVALIALPISGRTFKKH